MTAAGHQGTGHPVVRGRPVVVVGDVGLDVLVRPGGPVVHGSDTPSDVALYPGGAGGNTAAWLAAYQVPVALLARTGDDPAGTAASAQLEASGVRCVLAVDEALPTGMVVVIVDASGERTMLPDRGANAALRVDDVDLDRAASAALGVGMPHLHVSGYVLFDEGSRAAGLAALAGAARRGWTTSVDPQAASLIKAVGAQTFLGWVRGVDLLLPNESEADALGGPDVLLGLVPHVAVTYGVGGARWFTVDGHHHAPAAAVEAVDPTGAGDAFDAGLLASWVTDDDPVRALRSGVVAGGRAVATLGGRPPRVPPPQAARLSRP